MATIKIYGASDDLVEVEGDVPGCNEYSLWHAPQFVELSTGDVFKVEYTDAGVWKIDHIKKTKRLTRVRKEPHAKGDDPDPYTDTVTVEGHIRWVEVWHTFPPTADDLREKIGNALVGQGEDIDSDGLLSDEDVKRVWEIVANAQRRKSA